MDAFRLAVKAFIVNDGKLLLIKRRRNDVHKPGHWDIPGGRLEWAEDPFLGLGRETKEETGLEIEIVAPLDVHHFTRDDGQKITLIIFYSQLKAGEIKLSEEHEESLWLDVKSYSQDSPFPLWLHQAAENYSKYFEGK